MDEFKVPRRNILIGGGAAALFATLPFKAAAANPTAVCSKVGQKILFKGKNYLCKRVNGKLRWQGLVPLKPKVTTHPSPNTSVAPTPSTSPSTVSGFLVAHISDLKEGQVKVVQANDLLGHPVGVALILQGSIVTAHSVICTHRGCQVTESSNQLVCPCHGSVFSGASGAVIQGPAQTPLATFKVAQVGSEIYIVGSN
jgi:cytochrome b6-f complex iron-sulfur subunit